MAVSIGLFCFFFFNDTATTEIYTSVNTLSLHDALPIWRWDSGHPEGWHAGRRRGRDRQGPRGRRPGKGDRMEAPRNRDGRAADRLGFRQAEPAVPRSPHGRGGEETPRRRPIPAREHGPEGRGGGRVPRARRAARGHHRPREPGDRGGRQGRDPNRSSVSAEGFSPLNTFAARRWPRSRNDGTRISSDPIT